MRGFTPAEIRTLIDNAVEASWLASAGKARLRELLAADPGWSLPA